MSIPNIQISELFQSLEIMGSIHFVQWKKTTNKEEKTALQICWMLLMDTWKKTQSKSSSKNLFLLFRLRLTLFHRL
jgi:hypothetical protein